ncbi:MAG: hypothetical protein N3A53_08860, partial [Verrucomicrobiae bacterium]|nr:hypothetical protein [Verrucomicrobiae bacterium]
MDNPVRPDVVSVLHMLRQRAQDLDPVQVRGVSLVKQLSDRAAEILGTRQLEPSVKPVIAALTVCAQQMQVQVRFTDVGTVQQIGNGVARLSGLPKARTDE